MSEAIVKTCLKCGPLTQDKVKLRKDRNILLCIECTRAQQRNSRLKNLDTYRANSSKNRYIERPPETLSLNCIRCKQEKDVSKFNKYMLKVRHPYCIDCRTIATQNYRNKPESKLMHRKWYKDKYERIAENKRYMKQYGITLDQYEQILSEQNNLCAICKMAESDLTINGKIVHLQLDHCHETGKIRALLCKNCNCGLGNFHDSIEKLQAAIDYLKLHGD